ncbi:hypothetical protein D3C76_1574840 [compost metagenome]
MGTCLISPKGKLIPILTVSLRIFWTICWMDSVREYIHVLYSSAPISSLPTISETVWSKDTGVNL